MTRHAGILMHLTSLPSPYGVGTMGKAAYEFADFLQQAGQTYWQLLPVGPTSYGDSPYQSFSTYAGNPYLIDLDLLAEEGLLFPEDYQDRDWGQDPEAVDYGALYNNRFAVLRRAYERGKQIDQKAYRRFEKQNQAWLDDYALFMAIKSHFDMKAWYQWPDKGIRLHKKKSMEQYASLLKDEISFWKYVQYLFFSQWRRLKKYVNGLGIRLFGDMPIYVALDSADAWANPEVFWLDKERKPVCVAGCPPDYFSETGQLWGNPLYNWKYLKETHYGWWMDRIRHASKIFDVTRIDHFRAFHNYYAIPFGAENAVKGEWKKGPGMDFFRTLRHSVGDIPIIAEDLGFLTPGVHRLLKQTGYPGMKILQFAFDSGEENNYLPHNYDANSVVYTGTHDNDTTAGWFAAAKAADRNFAAQYCRLTKTEGYHWGLIRTAYASVSFLAIAQMQDFLGLPSRCRMNIPSTAQGNWQWRMKAGAATPALAKKIRKLATLYGRLERQDDQADEER